MAVKPNVLWRPAAQGNFKVGRSAPISQITFHHIVGDAGAAIARFQKAGEQASSTFVIGSDGTIYQMVAEKDTPYTDGNFASNSRSITIEHAGGHSSVPYTEAMYQASIQLCRYLIEAYGINSFKRHREVSDSPTACPGTLNVERIVAEAKGAQDHMRRAIPPNIVREHYINYVGHDPGVNSQATQNRFEDPEDDEFWYGLAGHALNVRKGLMAQVGSLTETNVQLNADKAQILTEKTALAEENKLLREQLADPDKIIITKKGFAALWEAIKSFFSKNN